MAEHVAQRVSEVADSDAVLVPVPLHRSRLALRGFNQAALCASLSPSVRTDLLYRVRPTRPQAGLSLKERELNLVSAFQCSAAVAAKHIVLIDDVVTSGHTARECARVLMAGGALSVGIVAFCGNLE